MSKAMNNANFLHILNDFNLYRKMKDLNELL
jgi:hypothetical protein